MVLSHCNPEDGFENYLSFAELLKDESPSYLYHLIPKPLTSYSSPNYKKANYNFFNPLSASVALI